VVPKLETEPETRRFTWFDLGAVAGVLSWIIVRAHIQAITIDEADTYLLWVQGAGNPWEANSNNHVLNSLLMLLSTSIWGQANLALRAPAILGAAIYTSSAWSLCRRISSGRRLLELSLYAALVLNPFVLDHLVAARGYSLAVAFLLCAIAIGSGGAPSHNEPDAMIRRCAACSLCLALSFAANFAFAFADFTLLVLTTWWCWSRMAAKAERSGALLRLLAATILPGLLISLCLTLPVISRWPKGQFTYGTRSLGTMLASIVESSLHQPNPSLLNPWLRELAEFSRPKIIPALGIIFLCRLFLLWIRKAEFQEKHGRWLRDLLIVVCGTVILTVGLHRLFYRLFRILMPMDRTALFLAPLCTLLIGIAIAIPLSSRIGEISGRLLSAALCVLAVYYLGCLRLSHFKEWIWNADVDHIYKIAAYYNHHYGVTDIRTTWMCVSSLNFYRSKSGQETFPPFQSDADRIPPGKDLYIVFYPTEWDAVSSNHLTLIYRGALSGIAVAVSPALAARSVSPEQ
jgi:hypothetical protein